MLLLQYREGLSDGGAMESVRLHLGWKVALGLAIDHPGIHPATLVKFRARLLLHGKERLALERSLELATELGLPEGASGTREAAAALHRRDGGRLIRPLPPRNIGVSRRGGEPAERVRHIAVDLLDLADTRAKLGDLSGVTHVFYAAYQERPSWAELVEPNLAMLVNSVEAIEAAAPRLRHVSLMQGYKVYGAHLGPFKTPAREDDPPHMPPEFNVDQQQFLEERRDGKAWTWSALRPSVVCGFALGTPMNLVNAIAVYASVSKQLGVPLRFPGKPGAWESLIEMTDADLLARATVWAATDERAANRAFNINNGDLFRWKEMWPKIAAYFELEAPPPLPMSLAATMADKEPLWREMVASHGLAEHSYAEVSSWAFADGVFSWDYDLIADGSRARRLGFQEFVETEAMFRERFDELRKRQVIP